MILSQDIHHETAVDLGPQLAVVQTCLVGPSTVQVAKRRKGFFFGFFSDLINNLLTSRINPKGSRETEQCRVIKLI